MNSSLWIGFLAGVALWLPGCDAFFASSDSSYTTFECPAGEERVAYRACRPVEGDAAATQDGALLPGAACAGYGEECSGSAECTDIKGPEQTARLCLIACSDDNECAGGRCTQTPSGRVCLRRCESHTECQDASSALLCIQTGDGTGGVCHPDGAKSGEVVPKAALSVVRIQVEGPSDSPGLEPGRTASVIVMVENTGSVQLVDVASTVEKQTALITDVESATSGPHYLSRGQRATVANVRITVDADAPAGAALPLVVHLVDGPTDSRFDLPVSLRVERSLARLVFAETRLERNGQPVTALSRTEDTTVRLVAANIGLTSTEGAVASVEIAGVTLKGTLQPATLSYFAAGSRVTVAQGNLRVETGDSATVSVRITGSNFDTLENSVTLPVE